MSGKDQGRLAQRRRYASANAALASRAAAGCLYGEWTQPFAIGVSSTTA